jgi:hypothetical protein
VTVTPTPRSSLIAEHGVYPNPFIKDMKLYYVLRDESVVTMSVFNVAGEVVYRQELPGRPGTNLVKWDGVNTAGARLASGVYLIHVKAMSRYGKEDDYWEYGVVRR